MKRFFDIKRLLELYINDNSNVLLMASVARSFKTLRTFSDLGGGKFRLFISKIYLKFGKETTELINIWISIIDKNF